MVRIEEFERANQAGEERRKSGTVVSARYDPRVGRVILSLSTGIELGLKPSSVQGLELARPADLDEIEITPSGLGVHFPKLDADLYLPALLEGIFGSRSWQAASLGSAGGSTTSEAKARAARMNGAKGGRPRKKIEAAS